jgi:hypothetical protein
MTTEQCWTERSLRPYWIQSPDCWYGWGVTAFSLADAIAILTRIGYEPPGDIGSLSAIENVRFEDLDPNVQRNMGPIVVRRLWYPFTCVYNLEPD